LREERWIWVLAALFLLADLVLAFRTTNWGYLDEATYIQASVRMLYGPQCGVSSFFPTVCNYEHPPLAKALEALSLLVFGWVVPAGYVANPINGPVLSGSSSSPLWFLAFRFFPMLFGTLSVVLVYSIAYSVSKNKRLALVAGGVLLLEPVFSFFSRTAFLDIPMLFFALCAYAIYLGGFRMGPVSEVWLAGVFLGLSALSKEEGIVFYLPLLTYHFLFRGRGLSSMVRESVIMLLSGAGVFAAGLQAYDVLDRTPFPTFINQVSFMASFSASVSCRGLCNFPPSPLDWFFSYTQSFWFDGFSPNLVLLWLVLLWIPVGCYLLLKQRRRGIGPEGRLFVLAALFFGFTFASDCVIYLVRGIYIWYYLPVVPSLCLGVAFIVTRPQLPNWSRAVVILLLVVGCAWAYQIGGTMLAYN
jgi:predicted membrane-bound dolichyl-phosphate-mannose-protein mannosyltransferase